MRTYTLDEANALLPRVRPLVAALREAVTGAQEAAELAADLERMWGERLATPECPDRDEHTRLVGLVARHAAAAKRALDELSGLGVEVKDPVLGLVDFRATRAGEVVYLCWLDGEASITHWHTLGSGFSGRRPLDGR